MQASVSNQPTLALVPSRPRGAMSLALQSFLLDCQARNLSDNTLRYYRQDLATFLAFLDSQGVVSPQGITPAIIRAYLVHLQQGHNEGGVHGHFRAMRAFVRFLVAEGEMGANPLAHIKAPRTPQGVLEPVALGVVAKMLKACKGSNGERDTAIILTLLDSGLRAAEMVALNVGDVDLGSGRVVVRHGKGDKGRVVFLGARARKAIVKMLRARGDVSASSPLWLGEGGERLAYWGLREILRRRARAAGVPEPSPHDFRRAFALLSLRGGCDVMALQKLMGHATLDVLRRYLAQTEEDLAEAHRRASPVDRML